VGEGETEVQEIPPEETGPVPIETTTVEPRFFGVTPPAAVLALASAALALGILFLVTSHVLAGGILLVVAGVLLLLFVSAARRLPDEGVSRVSRGAVRAVKVRTGYAVETFASRSRARSELFRLQHELNDLRAERVDAARALGEAVYAGDEEAGGPARARMEELDGLIAAKEGEMEQTVEGAQQRLEEAHLQVQPTLIETPVPAPEPEPYPAPSPPPGPVPVPEPSPEPSEPPRPTPVPEPGPEPSPPPRGD
jgi:hypothetical protein